VRGCDEPVIAGDVSKFQECTGWATEKLMSDTLQEMLNWWRQHPASNWAAAQPESNTHSLQA